MNLQEIAEFSMLTNNARKKAAEAKKNFYDVKEKQEELKRILEKNFVVSGVYPSDLLEQYRKNTSVLTEKSKNFAEATDFFRKCVQKLQCIYDQDSQNNQE